MAQSDDIERQQERMPTERQKIRRRRLARQAAARRLYSNMAGEPVLRRSFVVYIDELGTRAAAEAMTDDDLRRNIADSDRLRDMLSDRDSIFDDDQRVLTFSDNIVIGSPTRPFPELYGDEGQLFEIASIAIYLLNQSILSRFYRGGVAVGLLYIDDSYVAGPALVDAVDLEEKIASGPRVLLSEASAQLALTHLRHHTGGDAYGDPYNRYVLQDADGRLFVNYLGAAAEDEPYIEGAVEDALARHRAAVLARAKAAPADPKIAAKYQWLSGYHDWVCSQFFNHPDLLIDADRPPPAIRLLVER